MLLRGQPSWVFPPQGVGALVHPGQGRAPTFPLPVVIPPALSGAEGSGMADFFLRAAIWRVGHAAAGSAFHPSGVRSRAQSTSDLNGDDGEAMTLPHHLHTPIALVLHSFKVSSGHTNGVRTQTIADLSI